MWALPPGDTVLACAVAGGDGGAGHDGGTRRGKAQHGLGRRLHARLHHGAWRRHDPRRPARPLSAGLGPKHPSFLLLTAGAAAATILIARVVHRLNAAFLVLDAIGLVVLTMAGCDVAAQVDPAMPLLIVVVAGMITGCAGGVLRDILCNDVPLLFRAELYASISIVTGLFYYVGIRQAAQSDVLTALTFVLGLDVAPAGDPLQVGNAEIHFQRGQKAR